MIMLILLILLLLIIIRIVIIVIMNTENKLCTMQFSDHPMTDLQSVPEQQSWNPKPKDFVNFSELPKKTELCLNS